MSTTKAMTLNVMKSRYEYMLERGDNDRTTWANLALMFQAMSVRYHEDRLYDFAAQCDNRAVMCMWHALQTQDHKSTSGSSTIGGHILK